MISIDPPPLLGLWSLGIYVHAPGGRPNGVSPLVVCLEPEGR